MARLFGWDYPPGVTGREYEIAGPDYEKETDQPCPRRTDASSKSLLAERNCEGFLVEQGYRGQRWVVCSECDYQEDLPSLEESRYDTDERGSKWEPVAHRRNFRVEVDYDGYPVRNEAEAESLAREVSLLRGIKGFVIWDIEWECPNCHSRYGTKDALRGCCEASEGGS